MVKGIESELTATELQGRIARLRGTLESYVARARTPGLQYAFATPDGILVEHCVGRADPLTGRRVDSATSFNGYSIAKTLTALSTLQLWERGLIDLDSPLASQVSGMARFNGATVRQTLRHTAGFANPMPLRWVHRAADHGQFDRPAFVDHVLRRYGQPRRTPGKHYAYSNVGHLLLGELVATASGLSFPAYVRQCIVSALGLRHGETLDFVVGNPAVHARGCYRRASLTGALMSWALVGTGLTAGRAGPWTVLHDHCVNGDAYGGLICNAAGLLRYASSLMVPGRLLGGAALGLLLDSGVGPGPSRSLGWFNGQLHGARWCAHAGGGAGYYGELRMYPDLGCASALLLNRPGLRDARLLDVFDGELIAARAQSSPARRRARRW